MPVALTLADASTIRRWRERPDVMVRELWGVTPDAWQDDGLRIFPTKQRIGAKASKGVGKAQPTDTIVPTPTGDRRFGSLRPGDMVFGADGSPTKVRAVHERGRLPVFRVDFDDNSSTRCCGEHLWRVRGAAERARKHATPYRRETQASEIWSVLTTDEIAARGVRVSNGKWSGRQFEIPRQGAALYPPADLPIDPYVLGVWLGDGSKNSARYATKPTPEIAAEIRRRGYRVNEHRQSASVFDIIGKLRDLGILHLGSHERFVPEAYKHASPDQRRDMLRGLMDTDGGIGAKGAMEFAVTSRRLCEDFIWLARSVGGEAHWRATKRPFYYGPGEERIDGRDCYRIGCKLDFNPFLVPHRRARWKDPCASRESERYLKRYIDQIIPDGEAECVCIEVEAEDGCYLTNDFIVTHNSTWMSWCAWNVLLTHRDPNIAATSISGDNLRDGLWKEMALWRDRSPLLREQFEMTSERIFLRGRKDLHFMVARTWSKTASPEELGATLAGLHADNIMFILDEAGAMPLPILTAAEAALSSAKVGHVLVAGNTNTLDGALYHACVKQASLWSVLEINGDPDNAKRSPRVSLEWARQMVDTYGRDDPFVKVAVLGQWPEASINALFSANEVEEAMRRNYTQGDIERSPRILGVDVARGGMARSVIFPRQGLVAFKPTVMRNVTGVQGAARISAQWDEWGVDACFVDATGGFGSSWIDQLVVLNRTPIGVGFAEAAEDPRRFFNRRAEIFWRLRDWVRAGGALPQECRELLRQLPAINYTFKGDRLILEEKKLVEERIGDSLDESDGLALTFAATVAPRTVRLPPGLAQNRQRDDTYDPIAEFVGRR